MAFYLLGLKEIRATQANSHKAQTGKEGHYETNKENNNQLTTLYRRRR